MAFSDRGSLLPSNLYKLAFSQPLVAYVVVGIPTCSSLPPYLRIQRLPVDVIVTLWLQRYRFMDGFSQRKSLQLNQYQQHVVIG